MFAGPINQAKLAISGLVLKYVARASVAVPFVIGVAFALAAVTVMLINRLGYVMAYWLVARRQHGNLWAYDRATR